MAGSVTNELRNVILSSFRERVCEKYGVVPFPHQRSWWCASDGLELVHNIEDENGVWVNLPDGTHQRWATTQRAGGRARFLTDLGAFKIGKSSSAALWATGFAAVPGARVSLVGLEYDICAPEFDYLCDFLLSERGMNMKYESLQNRPRDGKMWLDLSNGMRYEARSWERKESLKGKEIDAYVYCEAYQLPGIECFTSFSQNLRARKGYAVFATTPDRPWIKELHALGHGADPEWHCTCGVGADVNPHTFDATAKARDEKLMTREKFQIHYMGQLGDFVGRVFNYDRDGKSHTFSPRTHPFLFREQTGESSDLRIPDGWDIVGAVDTGTYYTALLVAFSPGGDAFVIGEYPNYRYVAGLPERDEDVTIPAWTDRVMHATGKAGAKGAFWADKNSQFKRELAQYGMMLLPATSPLETRTEITREYFQQHKVWLAPWLEVLPFELENAAWPEEASATGKFARVKDRDHTLDCLEHALSRRPRGRVIQKTRPATWLEGFVGPDARRKAGNEHLGAQ